MFCKLIKGRRLYFFGVFFRSQPSKINRTVKIFYLINRKKWGGLIVDLPFFEMMKTPLWQGITLVPNTFFVLGHCRDSWKRYPTWRINYIWKNISVFFLNNFLFFFYWGGDVSACNIWIFHEVNYLYIMTNTVVTIQTQIFNEKNKCLINLLKERWRSIWGLRIHFNKKKNSI